ncbi:MAG: hypothetical protein VW378_00425 [bacterium]
MKINQYISLPIVFLLCASHFQDWQTAKKKLQTIIKTHTSHQQQLQSIIKKNMLSDLKKIISPESIHKTKKRIVITLNKNQLKKNKSLLIKWLSMNEIEKISSKKNNPNITLIFKR